VYESASETALVGGDFYDLVPLSGGRTAVIVGDVCGKGLDAATQTARARYMLRAYAKFDYDPGRWLAEVNDSLQDDMAEGDFVTVALAVVDPKRLTMRYALAGHPPPWVVTNEHALEVDGAPGLPLGVQSGELYKSYTVGLRRGARLLFYSDGLYEARSATELFGFEALPLVVGRLAGAPVRGFAELLAAEARAFAGGALKDDLVVVVLGLTEAE
jgi:sigma-B regulation protein RsbU (phosphoserine phosphatase)